MAAGMPLKDKSIKTLADVLQRANRDLDDLACFRERTHVLDEDMGSPRRSFDDKDEWDAMETMAAHAARRLKDALEMLHWNAEHEVGTRVSYWTGAREGDGTVSTTRTAATLDSAGQAVIWLEGVASS